MSGVREGAIAGFGNVAARGHLPGWLARQDFRIVAVAEPAPARQAVARELLPDVRLYANSEELLRHERLDFVDVASPPSDHVATVVAAAQRGVHVLCEKPLTTEPSAYARMRAAAADSRIVLHTVHNWKYSEAFLAVQRALAEGAIGSVRRVSFETLRDGCAAATGDNWRLDPLRAGGGILVDHGWHTFYLLTTLLGARPRRIRATLERQRYTAAHVEDTAHCVVEFPSCLAEIRLTWAASERRTCWRIEGTDGHMLIDDDRVTVDGRHGCQQQRLSSGLSAGSHHPEWFSGVLNEFRAELDIPARRGTNQNEAELCLVMLQQAYASGADASRPRDIPEHLEWPQEPADDCDDRDCLTSHGR